MKEQLICISTPTSRTYYKVYPLAKEFFDKEKNIVNTTGTIPNGEVLEFNVSSVSVKHFDGGKLHGKLEVHNLLTGTTTFSEEYDHGTLVKITQNTIEKNPSKTTAPAIEGTVVKTTKGAHSFYVNGQEVAEETISSNGSTVELLGNIPDGEVKEIDDNNQIKAIGYYKNNKLNGVLTRYDDEGQVLSRENYKEGILQGPSEYFSYRKDDVMHVKCFYKNALLEGEYTVSQKDGTLREHATYSHGHLQGEQTCFYEDGQRKSKACFEDGKLNGERLFFFPSGKIWYRENFVNGKMEGERLGYFEDGKLFSEEEYSDNLLHGTRKIYSQAGDLLISEEYHFGNLIHNTERRQK